MSLPVPARPVAAVVVAALIVIEIFNRETATIVAGWLRWTA